MPDDKKPDPAPAKPADKPVEKSELPVHIKIIQHYAFWDEGGRFREWREGELVTDPAEIALLVERKVRFWVPK